MELEAQGLGVKQIGDRLKVGESGVYTLKQKAIRRMEAAFQPMPIP